MKIEVSFDAWVEDDKRRRSNYREKIASRLSC